MIEQAARMALRYSARLRPVAGYTRDEAMQDARIGAWGALVGARQARSEAGSEAGSEADPVKLLALAGYRNILDGRSARWRRSAGGARELELGEVHGDEVHGDEVHGGAAPDCGAALVAIAQALRAIERLRAPLPEIARLLIEGHEPAAIAAQAGISASMASRHRRTLQATVSRYLGAPA